MTRTTLLRGLLCGAAFTALATAGSASAQDKSKDSDKVVEEVVVVGTNISGVKPVGSEAVTVGREEALQMGVSNVADVVRRLPQVQMGVGDNVGFQGGTAHQGYNGAQTETINLRGLGAAATLVLVDGRRPVGHPQGRAAHPPRGAEPRLDPPQAPRAAESGGSDGVPPRQDTRHEDEPGVPGVDEPLGRNVAH